MEGFLPFPFTSLEVGDIGLDTGMPNRGDVLDNARTVELGGLPRMDILAPPPISPVQEIEIEWCIIHLLIIYYLLMLVYA